MKTLNVRWDNKLQTLVKDEPKNDKKKGGVNGNRQQRMG